MVRFLYRSRGTDDHTVVALMVFQIIMVLAVSQGDVAFFCQQVFLAAVFIDHTAAIVRCSSCTSYLMNRTQLRAIRRIQIGYRIPVPERDLAWQI